MIEHVSGVAESQSLRTIEEWRRGIQFDCVVTVAGADWTKKEHCDDLLLLCTAIAATDSIGGKRSGGAGYVACGLTMPSVLGQDCTLSAETMERLRRHLQKKEETCPTTA
jgi:hypothetical protein